MMGRSRQNSERPCQNFSAAWTWPPPTNISTYRCEIRKSFKKRAGSLRLPDAFGHHFYGDLVRLLWPARAIGRELRMAGARDDDRSVGELPDQCPAKTSV